MLSDEEFAQLMDQARSGNADAARRLVELYEPEIRRAARMKLTDSKLRRIVDSIDICQSVFGKFFETAQSPDGVNLQGPSQLLGFLVTMTRNRVVDEYRRQTAKKRDAGDIVTDAPDDLLVANAPGPKTIIETEDMLSTIRSRLTSEELATADLRYAGCSWDEVAEKLGGTADSHRKRLDRAFQRVRLEMKNEHESLS